MARALTIRAARVLSVDAYPTAPGSRRGMHRVVRQGRAFGSIDVSFRLNGTRGRASYASYGRPRSVGGVCGVASLDSRGIVRGFADTSASRVPPVGPPLLKTMRIRDIKVEEVAAGTNWRLRSTTDVSQNMPDWEIEECSRFHPTDTVVYSALTALKTGEVWPLLVIREVGTCEWWGDTCEYVDGAWRELGRGDQSEGEEFVAFPLAEDPSFMGEYSHEKQRAGFARWRARLQVVS